MFIVNFVVYLHLKTIYYIKIMKKFIGNIVVNAEDMKVEKCYKKCLSLTEIDNDVPTLIVGLQNAKDNIVEFNILVKTYEDNKIWWTFSRNERRIDYVNDLKAFYECCIHNIIDKLEYKFINTNELSISDIKTLIKKLNNSSKKIYYNDNNKFVFVYDIEDTKKIYGISLNTCAFFGVSREKIKRLFASSKNCHEILNFYSIPKEVKKIINFEIPYELMLYNIFYD